jgi:hypothetical protein
MLCSNMNQIRLLIRKLWPMLKFSDGLTDWRTDSSKLICLPSGYAQRLAKKCCCAKNVLIALVDWKLYFQHLNYILKPDTHCACLAHNEVMVLTTRIQSKKGISSFLWRLSGNKLHWRLVGICFRLERTKLHQNRRFQC